MVSRSPLRFLQRKELVQTFRQRPRFDPDGLLVHQYDTGFSVEKSRLAEGDPPPDRADFRDWSPPTEEE
jgi:hypothetical protein